MWDYLYRTIGCHRGIFGIQTHRPLEILCEALQALVLPGVHSLIVTEKKAFQGPVNSPKKPV